MPDVGTPIAQLWTHRRPQGERELRIEYDGRVFSAAFMTDPGYPCGHRIDSEQAVTGPTLAAVLTTLLVHRSRPTPLRPEGGER